MIGLEFVIYLFFGVKMADLIADFITWCTKKITLKKCWTKLKYGNSLCELFRVISRNCFIVIFADACELFQGPYSSLDLSAEFFLNLLFLA
jgi:hypothetical protein